MAFTRIAAKADVPENQGRCFAVAGLKVAVFRRGADVFAIDDTCTHMGASLAEGAMEGDGVICPWHAALFSLRSGSAAGPPARGGVRAYPCRLQGDAIEIDVGST